MAKKAGAKVKGMRRVVAPDGLMRGPRGGLTLEDGTPMSVQSPDDIRPSQRKKTKSPSAPEAPPPTPPPSFKPISSLNPRVAKVDFDNLLQCFPGTPRPQQLEALEKIASAYNHGAKYVALEAPPGSGKSHIAMALSAALGPSYILTLTAQLQEQYVSLFGHLDLAALKGRGKYTCQRADASCAVGKALFKGENRCTVCPYRAAKEKALKSHTMVANYHSFFYNIAMAQAESHEKDLDAPTASRVRPFMVLDEAHSVESFLLDVMGLEMKMNQYSAKLSALPTTDNKIEPYISWLQESVPLLLGVHAGLTDGKAKDDLETTIDRMNGILQDHHDGVEFIPERGSKRTDAGWELDPGWFAIKPLTVSTYGERIWNFGNRSLLMSATVLDPGTLASNIGLPLADGEFIQLDSVFPIENRPIIVRPLPMSKENRDDSWPKVVKYVNALMDHHSHEKGLLLCPSNEMLKYIQSQVSRQNSNRFIVAFGENREERYNAHVKGSAPTILAASGYWEGADLADDASRFQIIPAVPRAMWNGQIKARAKISPSWYRWLSFTKLIQGYGRSVRSVDDSAITYIFDQEFVSEMNRARGSLIPDWVRKAVRVVGQ